MGGNKAVRICLQCLDLLAPLWYNFYTNYRYLVYFDNLSGI